MFIDLIYDLHDWANAEGDMADYIVDTARELLAVGAD